MINLETAIVYDQECLQNVYTFHMEMLHSSTASVWEISHYRDDRRELFQFLNYLQATRTAMIGFNIIKYDYPLLHFLYHNPQATVEQLNEKSQQLLKSNDFFSDTIWESNRFAPQIDLFKIHHFDNKAKTTSLKALEINMRSESVVDMGSEFFTKLLNNDEIDRLLIPYGNHDVKETKKFAHFSMDAIEFRNGLIDKFGLDVFNWNDTKIGEKILEDRIGKDICYDFSHGRRVPRQTVRNRIALNDIIFPYVQFTNPEFNRVLDYMRAQVLTPDDIEDPENKTIKTKGVFKNLKAHVGGIEFCFGTGGIHGSVESQRIKSDSEWIIRDIDVASLYPSIAIVNRLAPEHLGETFSAHYAELPKERKQWQAKKGKKCTEANSLKLAANGAYGKSNSKFSVLYDPQFTLTITINGQLLLCMLAEWLMVVPTIQLIQINTDGITYKIKREFEPQAAEICKRWEQYTCLTLESVNYNRMWIRDVNNYIAEDENFTLKQKGAYWHPDNGNNYAKSISEAGPPAWHKDFNPIVVTRAAVAHMVYGVDIDQFIRTHADAFNFMCRVKVNRSDKLMLGGQQIQGTSRYFVSTAGAPMVKISPPAGPIGAFKRKNGVTEYVYNKRMAETGGAWCETVCTKNKSKYEDRHTSICAGWKVEECNNASSFNWNTVNYDYYVNEARKLVI